MTLHSIELIAFDLDGTLIDSVPDLVVATNRALKTLNYPPVTEAQVRDWVGNGADKLLSRALTQDMHGQVAAELLTQARDLFNESYHQTQHRNSVLYPGALSALQALSASGMKLALITNKPDRFIGDILRQHQIDDLFVDIVGGDSVTHKKPHPEGLTMLMNKHGISAQQLMMVGDSKNDVLAAQNAGCISFAVTYGYNHGEAIEDSKPDYCADNLQAICHLPGLLA